MAIMTPEQFEREKNYQAAMALTREMLGRDIISEDEYDKMEAIFCVEYDPPIGNLNPRNSALFLIMLERHGNRKPSDEIALSTPTSEASAPEIETKPDLDSEPEPDPVVVEEPAAVAAEKLAPAPNADIDLPEEDLQALLHTLVMLDRAGSAEAKSKLAQVKGILVS